MFKLLKKLFGKKGKEAASRAFTDQDYEMDYELKSVALESILGKMHDVVGHALIPFAVGGAVDMYYFPNHIKGTAFATMELLEPDGSGPLPNRLGTYELVAFTRHDYNQSEDPNTAFNLIERAVCGIFTSIGLFSRQAVLNPKETCEIPNGDDKENTCLVFDVYQPDNNPFMIGERKHHLLLCLQVFRKEMEFARSSGSDELIMKLKAAGYYPYCDLDRSPVV